MTLTRLLAAAFALWLCADAGFAAPSRAGLSTFGNPPLLAAVWWLCGAAALVFVLRATDRAGLARLFTGLLAVTTLFGGRVLPSDPGLTLMLAGFTLFLAGPWLRAGPAAVLALVALLLALPSLAGGLFPHGGLLWIRDVVPPASLAVLVPALFDAARVRRLGVLVVLAVAAVCLAGLMDYVSLARGLDVPLASVTATRLKILGMHPNLAVPALAAALVMGCALAWTSRGGLRALLLLGTLLIALGLYAVRSRTGFAVAGLGLGLLLVGCLRSPWARWTRPLAALGVAALLLVPTTGLTDPTITRVDSSMTSKAVSFRSAMWELGRDTFAGAPWYGFGPNSRYVQGRFARPSRYDGLPKDDHPHNVVLGVGTTLGWPGLLGLALLFLIGARRTRGPDPFAVASGAAMLAVWAALAIDMGGADNTLYPALIFLLLGLAGASDRPAGDLSNTPPTGTTPVSRPWERGALLASALCLVAGPMFLLGEARKATVEAYIQPLETVQFGTRPPDRPADPPDVESTAGALRMAELLLPLDPQVSLLRARLARVRGKREEVVEQIELAREQMRDYAFLAHQLALSRSALIPRELFNELELLEEAVALDRYGELAWRRLLDRAQVQLMLGDRDAALESLVDALLLNPGAAASANPVQTVDGRWVILPVDEQGRLGLPLDEVVQAIERRHAQAEPGSATALRLKLRPVEILIAAGDTEGADELNRRFLEEHPEYRLVRVGLAATTRGDFEEAVQAMEEAGPATHYWQTVDELVARSQTAELDGPGFDATLQRAYSQLPDASFEGEKIALMLESIRRVAERQGDALRASRTADALAYAGR